MKNLKATHYFQDIDSINVFLIEKNIPVVP